MSDNLENKKTVCIQLMGSFEYMCSRQTAIVIAGSSIIIAIALCLIIKLCKISLTGLFPMVMVSISAVCLVCMINEVFLGKEIFDQKNKLVWDVVLKLFTECIVFSLTMFIAFCLVSIVTRAFGGESNK